MHIIISSVTHGIMERGNFRRSGGKAERGKDNIRHQNDDLYKGQDLMRSIPLICFFKKT